MKDFFKHFFLPHKGNDYKPHILREGAVLVIGIAAIILFTSSLGSSKLLQQSSNLAAVYSAVLVDLTNEARASNNEPALTKSSVLERAAQMKVDDMVAGSYFAHTSPTGVTPWHWFKMANYNFSFAGENLAIDFKESDAIEKAWLNSPGHRANILSNNFTEIGIAVKEGVYNGHKSIFVVQMFGKPKATTTVVTTTSNNSSTNSNTASVIAVAPSVKGESVDDEQRVTVVEENENTIVVEDIDRSSLPAFAEQAVRPVQAEVKEPGTYTPWYERMLINQPHIVDYALRIISLIVIFALVVYIFVEIRIQHTQQIIYGIILLVMVLTLSYYNHTFMLTDTPIFSYLLQ